MDTHASFCLRTHGMIFFSPFARAGPARTRSPSQGPSHPGPPSEPSVPAPRPRCPKGLRCPSQSPLTPHTKPLRAIPALPRGHPTPAGRRQMADACGAPPRHTYAPSPRHARGSLAPFSPSPVRCKALSPPPGGGWAPSLACGRGSMQLSHKVPSGVQGVGNVRPHSINPNPAELLLPPSQVTTQPQPVLSLPPWRRRPWGPFPFSGGIGQPPAAPLRQSGPVRQPLPTGAASLARPGDPLAHAWCGGSNRQAEAPLPAVDWFPLSPNDAPALPAEMDRWTPSGSCPSSKEDHVS